MKTVCLVGMTSGSHDSYQDSIILVFMTKEEGDQAVVALQAELEALKKVPCAANRFNRVFNDLSPAERTAEVRTRLYTEAQEAYEREARAILKVYPAVQMVEAPGGGQQEFFSPPSTDVYDGTDFYSQVIPISHMNSG